MSWFGPSAEQVAEEQEQEEREKQALRLMTNEQLIMAMLCTQHREQCGCDDQSFAEAEERLGIFY